MNSEKQTILIVDDQVENIDILNEVLCSNYNVLACKNGKNAIDIVEKKYPDIILLDVMMPEINGFEVCQKLKSNPNTSKIPIIFITAQNKDVEEEKGLQLGAVDYITKPISPSIVKARIKTHLSLYDQNRILDQKVKEKTAELAEANSRLANLEKTKSDFLSLISHELRTPLTSLTLINEMFLQMKVSKEQKEMLEFAGKSINRLIRFSEIALLITSLHAENFILKDVMPLPIKNLINETIYELKDLADKKEIEIIKKFSNDFIRGNGRLIIKCLNIILDNAIKHSPQNNQILIKSYNNKNVTIVIEDNGTGFSKEAMERLFDFFSCDDIMHHSEGFGLGLSTVKLIMGVHNGEIEVKNKENSGAIIKLIFPKY